MDTTILVRTGATGTGTGPKPAGASLRELPEGKFVTLEKISNGGSLQGRKLANGAVQFYWRYSLSGSTWREPLGQYDPSAPPKKREPSSAGLSIAAARERCRVLADVHAERRLTGGFLEAKADEHASFQARKQEQTEQKTRTVSGLLDTYVAHLKTKGRRSYRDAESIFRVHVVDAWPAVSKEAARDLSADQVLDMLRRLVEFGKGRTANKLRSYLHAAYQCAIDVRRSASIPVAFKAFEVALNPVAQTRRDSSYDRADKRPLSAEELRVYWRIVKNLPGRRGAALRLHLLTGGQRVQQLARIQWRHVEKDSATIFDGKGRPGQGPRPHQIPLLAQAVTALNEFSRAGEFVISSTNGTQPVEATTLASWAQSAVGTSIEDFQLKRVRSGVETLLASRGVTREIRGHLQSHGLTGVQARHYDAHDYLPEKRAALQVLYEHLEDTKPRRSGRSRAS